MAVKFRTNFLLLVTNAIIYDAIEHKNRRDATGQ